MGRSKLDKPKYPPIDWAMAAVLERKKVMGLNLEQIGEIGGTTGEYMRRLMSKSPMKWPDDIRQRVFRAMGIKVQQTIIEEHEV